MLRLLLYSHALTSSQFALEEEREYFLGESSRLPWLFGLEKDPIR